MNTGSEILTVVMPVYNEAGSIEAVVRGVAVVLPRLPVPAGLLIAEDGSTDGTKEILRRLQEDFPLRLVSGKERKGYTRAFKDALAAADSAWVLFSDSDGQHEPEDILKLWDASGDCDIVSGCKSPRRDPLLRIVLSGGYNFLIRLLFGLKMKDIDSGFKLIRKDVIDAVLPRVTTLDYCVMSEFILRASRAGYRIKEVPVTHRSRPAGQTAIFTESKLPGIIMGLLRGLWMIRREERKDQG